ncbi:hypothetical protein P8H27_04320 [Pseudomonas sp. sp1636]|uniref:hypothetical protein n=1 Tax=Pseudomonas sp. sp1636 TaxID=3036707 RepID=UPI0025A64A9A|nr:hypothetical protein [Pseudomonas sp. sp1636]MDM8348118.1 hypothetical protein [Pseudomonas sp. sp1636]
MSLSYQDPTISHDHAIHLLSTNDPELIISAIISIGLNETDWQWAQDICLQHLKNSNESIVSASITALSHIARLHEKLDLEKAINALKETQEKHPSLAGNVTDTLEDFEIFITNR